MTQEHLNGPTIRSITVCEEGSGDNYMFEGYSVGRDGVTRIEVLTKSGMYTDLPYVRVWKGERPYAEFCQHNIVGVYFVIPETAP